MHIFSPETDSCSSWISGRERMTVENMSWSISTEEFCRTRRGSNPRPRDHQSDAHPTGPPRSALWCGVMVSEYKDKHYSEVPNKLVHPRCLIKPGAGLGGSVGCAVRLETRRSRVQPPPRSATFFRGDWSWNIFYGHSLSSADSRRAVVSFWRKNVQNTG